MQVLDSNGLGLDSDIVKGVVWAADHHANVILMSFSNPGYSHALQRAINYAWRKGAVVVAATGNDGVSTPTYPAGDAKVVGVAGTDQSDAPWASSNAGLDTFIAAPATSIPADARDGSETSITGTSASAAMVAGAAALLFAKDPKATNAIVDGRLARNADAVGTTDSDRQRPVEPRARVRGHEHPCGDSARRARRRPRRRPLQGRGQRTSTALSARRPNASRVAATDGRRPTG